MKRKILTAVIFAMLVSLCFTGAYAEESADVNEDAVSALAAEDPEITVDAFELMQRKEEQYNTDMSPAYATRSAADENVDTQSGTLTLSQVDYSIPLTNGTFELKRIYSSAASEDDTDVSTVNRSISLKTSFYTERYRIGSGWRFSFPTLEIIRNDRIDGEDGNSHEAYRAMGKNIVSIMYHSESGAVYSIRPNVHEVEGDKPYASFIIPNHNLKDMEIKYIYDDGDSTGTYYTLTNIQIIHKKQGIEYIFDDQGKLRNIIYYNGNEKKYNDTATFIYSDNRLNEINVRVHKNTIDENTTNGEYFDYLFSFSYSANGMLSGVQVPGGKSILYTHEEDNAACIVGQSHTHYVLNEVTDIDGSLKNRYYMSRILLKKNPQINLYTYVPNGILYCRSNKLSEYRYATRGNQYGIDDFKVNAHQDYEVKGIDPAENYVHEISECITDSTEMPTDALYGFDVEAIGEKTAYEYSNESEYISISPKTEGIFEWDCAEEGNRYFIFDSTKRKTLRYIKDDETKGSTVNVQSASADGIRINNNRIETLGKGEDDYYIYEYKATDLEKANGYYELEIEDQSGKMQQITVSNVSMYVPQKDTYSYAEKFNGIMSFWQDMPEKTNTFGSFNYTDGAMYSWRRMHCEILSKNKYSDIVADATIQFMDDAITDHTSAGIVFRVSEFGRGNNNFNGYYARISPETDNQSNRSSIALFRMDADISNPENDKGAVQLEYETFASSGLNEACDSTKSYPMRVVANGNVIKIYVIDMIDPVITHDCSDDPIVYTDGYVGMRTFQRRAAFTSFGVSRADYNKTTTVTKTAKNGKTITTTYIYDVNNNLITQKIVSDDHKNVTAYEYDSNRMPKQIMTYECVKSEENNTASHSNYLVRMVKCENYIYDNLGNLVEYRSPLAERVESGTSINNTEDTEGSEILGREVIKYTYDDDCVLPKEKVILKDDNDTVKTVYTFTGEYNNLIASETVYENDSEIRKINYEYEKSGVLENKTITENGRTVSTKWSYSTSDNNYEVKTHKHSDEGKTETEINVFNNYNGNLISVTDAKSNITEYIYDNADRLITVTYKGKTIEGYVDMGKVSYAYQNSDFKNASVREVITIFTDENNNTTEFYTDAYGRNIKTKNGIDLSIETSKTYDDFGNMIQSTDGCGNVAVYAYDWQNRPVSKSINGNIDVTYSYDNESLDTYYITTEYANAGSETVTYDLKGREIKRTDGNGNSTVTQYDYMGNKISITDGNGNTTNFTYDALGRLTKSTKANGDITEYTYNVFNNLDTKVEGENVYEYTYDGLGRVTGEKAHLKNQNNGFYSAFTYDNNGNITSSVKGTYINSTFTPSEETSYTYDCRNRVLSKIVNIDGTNFQTTTYKYDKVGNLIEQTENISTGKCYVTLRTYDYAGNVTNETVKLGVVTEQEVQLGKALTETTYAYDNNGNLISKTCGAITENYTYDGKNRVKTHTSPNGLVTTYTYDSRDNVTSESHMRDEQPITTAYDYDLAGNLTSQTDPQGNTTWYEYDNAGNVIKQITPYNKAEEKSIKYQYDERNRLVKTIAEENGTSTILEQLTYDSAGNVVKKQSGNIVNTYVYDAAGNITKSTDGEGNSAQYTYDGSGRVLTQTDGNGNTTEFAYFLNGLPQTVTYADGTEISYVIDDFDLTGKYKVTAIDRMGNKTITENNIFGKPVKITYPDGYTEEFTYDALGRMTTSKDRMDTETTTYAYAYDNNGNLTEKSFMNGETKITETYTYSKDNLLLSYTDPCGSTTNYTYDKAGNLTAKTYPNNTSDSFTYTNGVLTRQRINGVTTNYTYDARGNISTQAIFKRMTAYQYDQSGNVILQINPDGGKTEYEYDKAGRLIKKTFGTSIAQYDYDGNGNVIEEVLNTVPASQKTYEYDELNNLTEVNDNGAITSYGYDKLGRCVKVTQNSNEITQTFYDEMGNVYAVKNAKGQYTLYTYDTLGRLLSTADSVSDSAIANISNVEQYKAGNDFAKSMVYTYDKMGNKLTETNALGNANTYTYDNCGRVKTVTYPDNNSVSYTYDKNGNMLTMTDAKGNTTNYEYANNRLIKTYDNIGIIEELNYSQYGEVDAKVDGEDNMTTYGYDSCGRLSGVTVNMDETTSYAYDKEGNKISMTDGNGHITTYGYGSFNRLMSITDAEGNTESYEYDARGNITRKTDGNGNVLIYGYDAKDNLTTVQYDDKMIEYTYDKLNNRTKMTDESGVYEYTYDNGNRIVSVKKDNEQYISYLYDKLGNVTYSAGIHYSYDECSRMKSVDGIEYTYDNAGNLKTVAYPFGTTEYTYDERNRVTKVSNNVGESVLSSYEYTYYNNNLEKTVKDRSGTTDTFTYDGAGRIKTSYVNGVNSVYEYDKAGNRTSVTIYKHSSMLRSNDTDISTYSINPESITFKVNIAGEDVVYGEKIVTYLYDKSNRLTYLCESYNDGSGKLRKNMRYVYDDAGNQISSVAEYDYIGYYKQEAYDAASSDYDSVVEVSINEYNGLNQLVETTNIKDGNRTFASYVYNGDGLRVKKTVDDVTTDYVYDGNYIVYEHDSDNNYKTYIHGLSYLGMIMDYRKYYYFCNAHGDVTNIVDSAGLSAEEYKYDEFGNLLGYDKYALDYKERERWFDNDIRYAGEFFDSESENYYLRSRYYDPSIGRFTQQDSFLGVDSNPLSLNRYTYCHNNPIMYVDPSGHYSTSAGGHEIFIPDNLPDDVKYSIGLDTMYLGYGEIGLEKFIQNNAQYGVAVNVNGGAPSPYSASSSYVQEDIEFSGSIVAYGDSFTGGINYINENQATETIRLLRLDNSKSISEYNLKEGLIKCGVGMSMYDIVMYEFTDLTYDENVLSQPVTINGKKVYPSKTSKEKLLESLTKSVNEYKTLLQDIGTLFNNSTKEALNKVLEVTPTIEAIINGMPDYKSNISVAEVQAIIFQEIRFLRPDDFLADEAVENTHLFHIAVEEYHKLSSFEKANTPYPTIPGMLKKDSSTGLGQMFAKTAIQTINWRNNDKTYDKNDEDDLYEVWSKLHNDEIYAIDLVAMHLCYLKYDLSNKGTKSIKLKDVFSRYNGTGTMAEKYGKAVYNYYLAFKIYNGE